MKEQGTNRAFWRRFARITLKTVLILFVFVILLLVLVQTPMVQNVFRKKVITYLEKKLNTRVEIGKIRISLPKKVTLENIYVEDQQKDTLISGGTIRANIDLFKLFSNEVEVRDIRFQNITAEVKRILPDTMFNFQFIVDAFTREKKTGYGYSNNNSDKIGCRKSFVG